MSNFPVSPTSVAGSQGQAVSTNSYFTNARSSAYLLGGTTTNATPASLLSNPSVSTSKITLSNNQTIRFIAHIVALNTANGDSGGYTLLGTIKRRANAGTTAIVGSVTQQAITEDSGASAWDATAVADTTNGALDIQVTGAAATTINWFCSVQTVEVS